MEILKSYKFRLKPTQEQQELLEKHFGAVRYVFNYFLNERKVQYEETKKSDNYNAQAKKLAELKRLEATNWLKEVNSQSLQQSLKSLDNSYSNFFKKRSAFPRFKSKKNRNSFSVPQNVSLKNGKISIPKFKNGIKFIQHQKICGEIRQATLSKSPTGKYYISILIKCENKPFPKTGKRVGIDLGIKDFCVTSDNIKFENHRFFNKYKRSLRNHQKHLSRKLKGSRRFENQKSKVALIYERIGNSRKDNLHKVSTALIKAYDVICLEDLNIKGMVKNRKLALHISDASWGEFIRMLEYKATWNEKIIIKVDRFFPSSKTCNHCGYVKKDLSLKERNWNCPQCGAVLDRDFNAAINILNEGLNLQSNRQGLAITPVERIEDLPRRAVCDEAGSLRPCAGNSSLICQTQFQIK